MLFFHILENIGMTMGLMPVTGIPLPFMSYGGSSFLSNMIAVGIDIKDGYVAIKGWTEKSQYSALEFMEKMQNLGVKTIICTDISKDGAMKGTNLELYKELSEKFNVDIIASGGVSTLEDIKELRKMNIYGAIVGKAYYTKAISIDEAIEVAK